MPEISGSPHGVRGIAAWLVAGFQPAPGSGSARCPRARPGASATTAPATVKSAIRMPLRGLTSNLLFSIEPPCAWMGPWRFVKASPRRQSYTSERDRATELQEAALHGPGGPAVLARDEYLYAFMMADDCVMRAVRYCVDRTGGVTRSHVRYPCTNCPSRIAGGGFSMNRLLPTNPRNRTASWPACVGLVPPA